MPYVEADSVCKRSVIELSVRKGSFVFCLIIVINVYSLIAQ